MADTKLADLTALTTPSGDDILYVVDDPAGTPADRKMALNNLFTRGTVTISSPVIDASQTWNAGAVTFTGLKFNATDTASAASSLLMDLQVGGSSRFSVSKTGQVQIAAGSISAPSLSFDASSGFYRPSASSLALTISGGAQWAQFGNLFRATSTMAFGWASGEPIGNNIDTILTRRGTANLRLGAADAATAVAQTLSVQSGTAGASALSCSISGTTLTVGGAVTGTIAIGHAVTGTGVSAGTIITAGSGTTWTVNNSQTVSSTTMYFNSVGRDFTITGSQASGPSPGGSIVFQVAPAGAAGTTAQNALATALTINSSGQSIFAPGVLATPSVAFSDATTTGFFSLGPGNIGVSMSGTERYRFGSGGRFFASDGISFGQNSAVPFSVITSSGYGTISFTPVSGSATILQIGGTTSSFPALKRSSTTLQARLADDSAFASVQGKITTDTAYTAGAPTATGYLILYDSSGTAYRVPAVAN